MIRSLIIAEMAESGPYILEIRKSQIVGIFNLSSQIPELNWWDHDFPLTQANKVAMQKSAHFCLLFAFGQNDAFQSFSYYVKLERACKEK